MEELLHERHAQRVGLPRALGAVQARVVLDIHGGAAALGSLGRRVQLVPVLRNGMEWKWNVEKRN